MNLFNNNIKVNLKNNQINSLTKIKEHLLLDKDGSKKHLKEVSHEFEALFLKMMFKKWIKTTTLFDNTTKQSKNNVFLKNNQTKDFFNDMLLRQRTKQIANHQSVGIAKMIYEQNLQYIK